MNDIARVPGATKRSLERVSIRTRESGVTHSGWRMEVDSDEGSGTITLVQTSPVAVCRGDGIFLGWSQEQLADMYNALNAPPDEPTFELQQLG